MPESESFKESDDSNLSFPAPSSLPDSNQDSNEADVEMRLGKFYLLIGTMTFVCCLFFSHINAELQLNLSLPSRRENFPPP